ncbi:unnamed protein product [Prorocentrum cordatum]|uniref:MYND-type domain-containing protein n=1 Tax=Prorocentrum cordatum TaxID=2364126 RepID=A0ABN9VNF6_9DINO|nr:unnamed protein product [Polarella glacialis]
MLGPCLACGRASEALCSRCRAAAYCGPGCQRADWKRHRPLCTGAPARAVASSGAFGDGRATSVEEDRLPAADLPPPVPEQLPNAAAHGGDGAAAAAARLSGEGRYAEAAAKLHEAIQAEGDPARSLQKPREPGVHLQQARPPRRGGAPPRGRAGAPAAGRPGGRGMAEPRGAGGGDPREPGMCAAGARPARRGRPPGRRARAGPGLQRGAPPHGRAVGGRRRRGGRSGAARPGAGGGGRRPGLPGPRVPLLGGPDLGRHEEAMRMCERVCRADVASTYAALREVFRCRAGDVFVATYPRCGTTWMVQVCTCVLHGAEADRTRHAVFLEGAIAASASSLWTVEGLAAPRIIKTHAPADSHAGLRRRTVDVLQDHGKVIYVVRNPKDTLSLRHHHSSHPGIRFEGSWDDWVDGWLRGERSMEYGGTYFDHVRGWWHLHRRHPSTECTSSTSRT